MSVNELESLVAEALDSRENCLEAIRARAERAARREARIIDILGSFMVEEFAA